MIESCMYCMLFGRQFRNSVINGQKMAKKSKRMRNETIYFRRRKKQKTFEQKEQKKNLPQEDPSLELSYAPIVFQLPVSAKTKQSRSKKGCLPSTTPNIASSMTNNMKPPQMLKTPEYQINEANIKLSFFYLRKRQKSVSK